jgi:hypothetical protein
MFRKNQEFLRLFFTRGRIFMQKDQQTAAFVQEQKQKLSQYKRLLREIKEERARLAQLSARLLRGAAAGLPDLFGYTSEDLDALRRHIDENLERCLSLAAGLQQYINGIADSETRRLFILRYVYGYSWQKVAFAMDWYDESVPRKKHDRYLAAHGERSIPAVAGATADSLADIDVALRREALETGQ